MQGRKPLPTVVHRLNGNPGKRALPVTVEDKFSSERPEPPELLTGEALAEWERVMPQLSEAGILKKIDRVALAQYCLVYARWVEAETQVKSTGPFVRTKTGYLVMHPSLKLIEKYLEQMKSYMADFGMTPASRVRIKPGSPGSELDPLEAWMQGGAKQSA